MTASEWSLYHVSENSNYTFFFRKTASGTLRKISLIELHEICAFDKLNKSNVKKSDRINHRNPVGVFFRIDLAVLSGQAQAKNRRLQLEEYILIFANLCIRKEMSCYK